VREYYQYAGGIQARLAYLPFIGNIVGLVALVASLNIGLIIYSRLNKKRYEIGVRRSLGASRSRILGEQLMRMFPIWLIAIGAGLTLSLALAPIAGAMFQASSHIGQSFPVSLGLLTAIFATVASLLLGSAVALITVRVFLQKSSATLLREGAPSLASGLKGKLTGGAGLAAGTLALMVLFSLRDGALIHFDHLLGWAGGDRAGSVVDWLVTTNYDEHYAELSYGDYLFLNENFPKAQFGWLGRKGDIFNPQVIEASASMNVIRPPKMVMGRWITPDEEQRQTHVAVLGYDLGHQVAAQRGIPLDELLGQIWRSYTIIGVMDEWPLRYGLGYYTDVAYVPIGTHDEETYYPGGQIAFIAPQGVNMQDFVRQISQALKPGHPEGPAQFILVAEKVGELLEWRLRLYFLLSAFAVVSLLIGSFGVMNWIFMWIVSRWREIGIRRAVGAQRAEIARMVLAQALRITLAAAFAGGTIGTAIALVVQQRSGWPLTIYPYWLAVGAGIAIFSALIFGGLPAWWAATRPPTEMLRME
jgi:putative ABC transport system permease protein